MYIYLFVISLVAMFTLAILYMLVAYHFESIKRIICGRKYPRNCENCRQDNDVWNISGRVNGMDTWPTHDHHVSIDSFAFPPEYQAKDPRNAPPPYTEVDLPTYEEAILACQNQKNNLQVVVPIHMGQTESNEPHQH